jgi:hypothetical protein
MFGLDLMFISLALLITAVISLIFSTVWLLYKLEKNKKDLILILEQTEAKSEKYLKEARVKVEKMMLEAEKNASDYLSKKKIEIDSSNQELENRLETLEKRAEEIFIKNIQTVDNFTESLSEKAFSQMESSAEEVSGAIKTALISAGESTERRMNQLSEKTVSVNNTIKELDVLSSEVKNVFSESTKKIQNLSEEISVGAKKQIQLSVNEVSKTINGMTGNVHEQLDEGINKMVVELGGVKTELSKKLNSMVDSEFSDFKKEMEDYKISRLKVVDEQIVTLVEETVRIALNNNLSKEDHRDIIYRALEEAKKEGVFN